MKTVLTLLLHTVFLYHISGGTTTPCTPPDTALSQQQYVYVPAHTAGDDPKNYLYLGGIFGVHDRGETVNSCGSIRTRGVHNLEAFLWAVKTFKTRYPTSLAGVSIGAVAFDSCSDNFHLMQQYANFQQCLIGYGQPVIDPATVLAYVGPDRSGEATELAKYVGTLGAPMISHAATSGTLSNITNYPRFLRTVPSDTEQVQALVNILTKRKWKHVQFLHSDNTYGTLGKESFKRAAKKAGICIVNNQAIPETKDQMNTVLNSLNSNILTRAVVVFANEDVVRAFLEVAHDKNIRGRFTWFGTTAWGTASTVSEGIDSAAEGAITLSLENDILPEFVDYFNQLRPIPNNDNKWFMQYWSDAFKCYFADIPNPNGYNQLCDDVTSSLSSVQLDGYVGYTIKAVDAALLAIDEARKSECTSASDGLCDELLKDGVKWDKIFNTIIQLKRNSVNVFNLTTGDPLSSTYEINNYRSCSRDKHCFEKIGVYKTKTDVLDMEVSEIHSYDLLGERIFETTSTCGQTPCTICGEQAVATTTVAPKGNTDSNQDASGSTAFESLTLRNEPWVVPLVVLTGIGVLLLFIFDIFLLRKIFRTPYMKHWRTMWLGQLLLIGILLCYLTVFAFIPNPTKATCGIIRFGVGVSYAMCFSVLLVKLLIILSSESIGELKGVFQVLMFLFAWGVQIAVDSELLVLKTPGVEPSKTDPSVMVCKHGDFIEHVISLVYVMFLIFVCTILAIRTHKISTNHREGVFIGICTGFSIPIWLVWILFGILFKEPSYHDPCLAFGLFGTATLLLFVMFLPKVRQLNSMGVEGIYAEDDSPDYSPSVIQQPIIVKQNLAPSVRGYPASVVNGPPSVIGYAPSRASEGSLVLIPNGSMNKLDVRQIHQPGPYALHYRHVNPNRHHNIDTASIHSAPLEPTYIVKRTRPQPTVENHENIEASTRVLRMTNDLTGRKTPGLERRAKSEDNLDKVAPSGNITYRPVQHTVTADVGAL